MLAMLCRLPFPPPVPYNRKPHVRKNPHLHIYLNHKNYVRIHVAYRHNLTSEKPLSSRQTPRS